MRVERERAIAAFAEETQRLLDIASPGSVVITWSELLDVDTLVHVRVGKDERIGSFDRILAAAGGDPSAAARRGVNLVMRSDEEPTWPHPS